MKAAAEAEVEAAAVEAEAEAAPSASEAEAEAEAMEVEDVVEAGAGPAKQVSTTDATTGDEDEEEDESDTTIGYDDEQGHRNHCVLLDTADGEAFEEGEDHSSSSSSSSSSIVVVIIAISGVTSYSFTNTKADSRPLQPVRADSRIGIARGSRFPNRCILSPVNCLCFPLLVGRPTG